MRLIPILVALLVAATPLHSAGSGEETAVSRTPPEIYTRKIAPLLSDPAELLKAPLPPGSESADGIMLLSERIDYVTEDGKRLTVSHYVVRAETEAGAKQTAEDIYGYRRRGQKIHLALARTFDKAGKATPIRENAAILQHPQREGDEALYSDEGELVIVYPNVKPGTVAESIVVHENVEERMPGEFTGWWGMGGSWPQHKVRSVVDLPEALAARLRWTEQGTVPARKEEKADGRVRWSWESGPNPLRNPDCDPPPLEQSGPGLWASTVADWNAVGRWFAGLAADRGTLSADLRGKLEEWTKDVTNPRDILAVLLRHVADDVRYTGMEFGLASHKPYDCNETWENQYGDCKDKANLLRALLAARDIRAHFALLDTRHAGRLEKRSPDFRHFNHVILAVDLPEGRVFCDPTIRGCRPGMIGSGDAARDVLLILDGTTEWARTPSVSAGDVVYSFDLARDAAGRLSGWMEYRTTGTYGASSAAFLSSLDRADLQNFLHRRVQAIFPSAQVIDFQKPESAARDAAPDTRIRTYIIVPASGDGREAVRPLDFPGLQVAVPDFEDEKTRSTELFLGRDLIRVEMKVDLGGVRPKELPKPFEADVPGMKLTASWTGGEKCLARLQAEVTSDVVAPGDYPRLWNALNALRAWTREPLALTAEGTTPPSAAEAVTLENFPVMPTGQGQMTLVDERYPADGDRKLRREALQRTLQYFPDDGETQLYAKLSLAVLDYTSGEKESAQKMLTALEPLLANIPAGATPDTVAWGHHVQGAGLAVTGKEDEAVRIWSSLVADEGLTQYRRGASLLSLARNLIRRGKADAALVTRLAQATDWPADEPAWFWMYSAAASAQTDALEEFGRRFIAAAAGNLPPQSAEFAAEGCGFLSGAGHKEAAEKLEKFLRKLELPDGPKKEVMTVLDREAAALKLAETLKGIREDLKKIAADALPEKWLEEPMWPEVKTAEEWSAKLSERLENNASRLEIIRGAVDYLTRFEPGEYFSYWLWQAAIQLQFAEKSGSQFRKKAADQLIELGIRLPETDDYHWECIFLKVASLEERGLHDEEEKVLRQLREAENLPENFRAATFSRLAECLYARKNYAGALKEFTAFIPVAKDRDDGPTVLCRAGLLALETGDQDKALEFFRALNALPKAKELAKTEGSLKWLMALTADEAEARKWWAQRTGLLDIWKELIKKTGHKVPADEPQMYLYEDTAELGTRLSTLMQERKTNELATLMNEIARSLFWVPEGPLTLSALLQFLPAGKEDPKALVRDYCMRFFRVEIGDPVLRYRYAVMEAAYSADAGKPEDGLALLDRSKAPEDLGPVYSMAGNRVRAMLLVKSGKPADALPLLEKLLADQDGARVQTLSILNEAFTRLGRTKELIEVLERELKREDVTTAPGSQALADRLKELKASAEKSTDFAAVVATFLKAYPLPWLDACPPAKLPASRLKDPERFLNQPPEDMGSAETVRNLLLLAGHPEVEQRVQWLAFSGTLGKLADSCRTGPELIRLAEAAINCPQLSPGQRQYIAGLAVEQMAGFTEEAPLVKLLDAAGTPNPEGVLHGLITSFRRRMTVDIFDPAALAGAAAAEAKGNIGSRALGNIRWFAVRMSEIGAADELQALYDSSAEWTLDDSVDQSLSEVRLGLLRMARFCRPVSELCRGLDRDAAEIWKALEARADTEFVEVLPGRRTHGAISENRVPAYYAWLRTRGRFRIADPDAWIELARSLSQAGLPGTLAEDFCIRALSAAMSAEGLPDAVRTSWIIAAPAMLDSDDAGKRERILKAIEPMAGDNGACGSAVRMMKIRLQLRTGGNPDVAAELDKSGGPQGAIALLKLTWAITRKSPGEAKEIISALSTRALFRPEMIEIALHGFEHAGMNDELELARERGISTIPALLADAFLERDSHSYMMACRLAVTLRKPELIPPGMERGMLEITPTTREQEMVRMSAAWVRKDWSEVARITEAAVRQWPTFYVFHQHLGEALFQLGKMKEAAVPLRTAVQYECDDVHWSRLKKMLAEADAAK